MKRANGTGSVVKLSGNRRKPYAIKVSDRDSRGYVVQKVLSCHPTAREAQEALDQFNMLRRAGLAPEVDQLNMTVQQVFDAWSAREYPDLKPASIVSHNAAWSKRVSRYAARKMRSVTLDEWQAILDEDEDEGRSQSLINNDAVLIRALNRYAMKRDIIVKDYSVYLEVPTVGAIREKGAFTDLQLAKLEQMAADGFPWADVALILCYTGFRTTELLTMTQFSFHREQGGYLQGGIKTRNSKNRIVPIHPKIRPYLDRWLAKNGDAIICDKKGRPLTSDAFRDRFSAVAAELNAPAATPHWCRHTFATRLHAAEVDELTVKWLMGHSTRGNVTAVYTHPELPVLSAAIRRLA